jgi:hypothetical protein
MRVCMYMRIMWYTVLDQWLRSTLRQEVLTPLLERNNHRISRPETDRQNLGYFNSTDILYNENTQWTMRRIELSHVKCNICRMYSGLIPLTTEYHDFNVTSAKYSSLISHIRKIFYSNILYISEKYLERYFLRYSWNNIITIIKVQS